MTLYISNSTKQHVIFPMRFAGVERLHTFHIPSGGQIAVGSEYSEDKILQLIEHLERHGARDAAEMNGKPEEFSGLVYRFDRPMKEDEIVQGHEIVVDDQQKRSVREAVKGGLGFDRAAQQGARGKRLAEVTEVEVVQEIGVREKPTGNEVRFGMRVDPTGGDLPVAV